MKVFDKGKYSITRPGNKLLLLLMGMVFSILPLNVYAQKSKAPKEEPQPTTVTLSAVVPSFAPLAESPQTQVKGGLRITVAPATYIAKDSMKVTTKPAAPPSKFGFVMIPEPGAQYVERTSVPKLTVNPSDLVFRVSLDNQMAHVFRGSGLAVQYNVAGKVVSVDPSGYGDLVNIILPPRSQQEILIHGPAISTMPVPSNVGLFFYDVVTDLDAAGNVKEKQNFEWYFSYQGQKVDKDFSVPPPEKLWIMPK